MNYFRRSGYIVANKGFFFIMFLAFGYRFLVSVVFQPEIHCSIFWKCKIIKCVCLKLIKIILLNLYLIFHVCYIIVKCFNIRI